MEPVAPVQQDDQQVQRPLQQGQTFMKQQTGSAAKEEHTIDQNKQSIDYVHQSDSALSTNDGRSKSTDTEIYQVERKVQSSFRVRIYAKLVRARVELNNAGHDSYIRSIGFLKTIHNSS